MRELILIRHSYAEPGMLNMSDFNRDLTSKGVERAVNQSKLLKDRDITPSLIISSNAVRAIKTARIFADIFGNTCPIQEVSQLYDDLTTADFFNILNKIDNSMSTVLLFGHNPTMERMASMLCNKTNVTFKPCHISAFSINNDWKNLQVGNGIIEYQI